MSWSSLQLSRRRHGGILPLQPACRVDHGAVLLGEARARQAIDRGVDLLHLLRRGARRLPEGAGLVGIDFADHQEVGFLQGVDVLLGIGPDHDAVHAEGEESLHLAFVHVVPVLHPGILAIDLGQIVEGEVVLFRGGVAVHRLQERHRELRRVRPVVERLPLAGLRWLGRHAVEIGLQVLVGGRGHLEIAGKDVEDPGHVGCALNVGVSAQRIDAAAGASDVAHQQLQHGGGADDLRAEGVLRPADRVDDGGDLLHVAILADGGEHVPRLQKLVLRNAGDARNHLRRVARVLLLQQLIDAARMSAATSRRRRSAAGMEAESGLHPCPLRRPDLAPDSPDPREDCAYCCPAIRRGHCLEADSLSARPVSPELQLLVPLRPYRFRCHPPRSSRWLLS